MGTMVREVYEALIEAGASEAKAKAAAEAIPVSEKWATKQDIAVLKVEIAAEQGGAEAQYNLGVMYNIGDGVPEDKLEAAKWFRKAAEQGLAVAQAALGLQLLAKDKPEAVKWFRKAAEQGSSSAQFHLGRMYGGGMGVPKDFVRAYAWFNLAAGRGWKTPARVRDRLAEIMSPEQVAEAQELACELYRRIESSKTE